MENVNNQKSKVMKNPEISKNIEDFPKQNAIFDFGIFKQKNVCPFEGFFRG
jgi:hypothetical protein